MAEKKQKSDQNMYTGWCNVDDIESNRERNRAILDKHLNSNTKKLLEMAAEQVPRLIDELKYAIDKRRSTLSTLRDLANELDSMKGDVDIAKVTGSSAAVAGGAMAITGGILSVFTFGLASPMIAAGVATAVASGVTAGGAEIAEAIISKDKMEKAQGVLNADKNAMSRVDDHYANLARIAENISQSSPHLGSKDQILCSLFVANKFADSKPNTNVVFAAKVCAVVCAGVIIATMARTAAKQSGKVAGRIGPKVASRLAPKLASVFAKGTVEVTGNVARTVLRGAAAVAMPVILGFDIYELVKVSISISKGSKSAAAELLRKLMRGYEEQLEEMLKFLTERSSLADGLEEMLKEEFKSLLENISSQSEVSDEEVAEVWGHLQMCEKSESWQQAFRDYVADRRRYVLAIARIFKFVKQKIEEYQEREKKKERVVDLTFLAHGHVENPLVPCTLHYLNERVEFIKLYVPWGCLLKATAAYGICTGMISVNNVQYSDIVLPAIPSDWNTLPKDFTQIPQVVFTPVNMGEDVYKALTYIASEIQGSARGLVIEYFNAPGDKFLPAVPLWALSNAVAIVDYLLNMRFRIHIASCLSPKDETILTHEIYPSIPWRTVNCRQYCAVPIKHDNPVYMRMMYDVPDNLKELFDVLNQVLGTDPE